MIVFLIPVHLSNSGWCWDLGHTISDYFWS